MSVIEANDLTIPRISQLTRKTNQFNMTTRRYTDDDIRSFALQPHYLIRGIQVKDRFGDYGLVGVFIIDMKEKRRWVIETLLLSCRVLGRCVEQAVVDQIKGMAEHDGVAELVGLYHPTKKNIQAASFYEQCGFSRLDEKNYMLKNPTQSGAYAFISVE